MSDKICRKTRAGDCWCGWRREFGERWEDHIPLNGYSKKTIDEVVERLEELWKSWTAQGDRYEVDGHEANAQEMYDRAFGANRAVTLIRDSLETGK